jgi:hypothetical protein
MSAFSSQVMRKSRSAASAGGAADTSRRRCEMEQSYLDAHMRPLLVGLKECAFTDFTTNEDMLLYSFVMNICRHCPEKARDRDRLLGDINNILHASLPPGSRM